MEIFQDQGIIQAVVAVLLVLAAWWVLRTVMRWIRRLSRLGCLAGVALLLVAVILIRLS
jgi:choline-glycine betaine transporter